MLARADDHDTCTLFCRPWHQPFPNETGSPEDHRRSLVRAMLRKELWAGNRERWLHMLRPGHPIRWAWSTWRRHRRVYEERIGRTDYAHLVVLRLRRPRDAEKLLGQLMRGSGAPGRAA